MVAPEVAKWNDSTSGDSSRLNQTSIIRNLGTYLAALNKEEFTLVVANDTSGGYILDHVYLFAKDGVTKIDITAIQAHTHAGSSDGGNLIDVFRANPKLMDLLLTKTNDLQKAQWLQTVTGGGTIEDFTDGTTNERAIRLRPNLVSGDSATIQYPHLKLDFSLRSFYQVKLLVETASSLSLHSGTNMDNVTAVDSNTVKYGIEICTALSPPANANWNIRSSNGSGTSLTDTGIAFTTNRTGIRVEHYPDLTQILAYIDASSSIQKTSHIPTSGQTADNNAIKHSLKNSTGADRPVKMFGCRLRYIVSDNWV